MFSVYGEVQDGIWSDVVSLQERQNLMPHLCAQAFGVATIHVLRASAHRKSCTRKLAMPCPPLHKAAYNIGLYQFIPTIVMRAIHRYRCAASSFRTS